MHGSSGSGNLGTIIRTADAAGASGVILSRGTVDLYNQKVIRSTMGSLFHLPVVKTRFFNSYGPGEIPGQYRNVIPNFIYWAMSGKALPITGTGEETRDFTFVGDIVDGLLRAGVMEGAVGEEFNLASGKEIQIKQLAEMINDLTGNDAGIKFLPRRKWDTKSRIPASVDKAKKLIGYTPNTTFEEGLPQAIEWFKKNWGNIEKAASFGPGTSSAVRSVVAK